MFTSLSDRLTATFKNLRGKGRLSESDVNATIRDIRIALLDERDMTLTALADAVGVSLVNLSIMKNNRAKAIRYSTLTAICQVLNCQPGELLSLAENDTGH